MRWKIKAAANALKVFFIKPLQIYIVNPDTSIQIFCFSPKIHMHAGSIFRQKYNVGAFVRDIMTRNFGREKIGFSH